MWEMPLTTGLRYQAAYKEKNSDSKEDKGPPPGTAAKYAYYYDRILNDYMPEWWVIEQAALKRLENGTN